MSGYRSALICVFAVALLVSVQAASDASPETRYRSEDVRYHSDSVELAALLMLPESGQAAPGAVIIQGAGTSDRSNRWATSIAEELVRAGVAVLLTDKRGSGASQGDWRTAGFAELARDALAGAAYLRTRREVDPRQVGLVGLSQGGWVAPLAAARGENIAFVIGISAAAVSFAEQSFHELANTARQAGIPEARVEEVLKLNRAAARYLASGNWRAYDTARQHALASDWKQIAEGFPASPGQSIWTFLDKVADYDPLPYWLQLDEPVLMLFGAEDEYDNVPVAESVRRLVHAFNGAAKPDFRIVVVPAAGHGFIDAENKTLMPGFVDALGSWVRGHVLLSP